MIKFSNQISLEEIAEKNISILIDNCAINGYFLEKSKSPFKEDVKNMGDFIIQSKSKYPLFTTYFLYKEEMDGIRKIRKKKGKENKNNIYMQLKRRMLKVFDSLKTLELNQEEQELYSYFYEMIEKHSSNLSEPDFNLLINGITLTQSRGNCAILSNDFGILKCLSSAFKKDLKKDLKYKINFYIRTEKAFSQMKI